MIHLLVFLAWRRKNDMLMYKINKCLKKGYRHKIAYIQGRLDGSVG